MVKIPRVMLLLESSRAPDQGLLRGIAKYSRLHGPWSFYRRPPAYINSRHSNNKSLLRLKEWEPDGIITLDSGRVEDVIGIGVPTIIASVSKKSLFDLSYILSDSEAIGEMAAEYLLSRGFKNFAFCGFGDLPWSKDRGESFARKITEAGFEINSYSKSKSRVRHSLEYERELISDWLKSLNKPIAVLACNDDRSQDIVEACKINNLHIPVEVAILGVDNDEFVCDLSHPSLSSIALDTEKAGYQAAELLDKLMKSESTTDQAIVSQPTHVVTRQSTDILVIEDQDVAEAVRFILQHAKQAIQVTDVIDSVSISRRALERRFRNILGYSINKEIRRVRIDQVVRMLVETNLSISEIAVALDYPGIEHIARYFRKEKGMSLLAYRKRHRGV